MLVWRAGEAQTCLTEDEISHINVLELYATKLVLQSLAKSLNTCHIKILLDNTTAISYLNRMGVLTQYVYIQVTWNNIPNNFILNMFSLCIT